MQVSVQKSTRTTRPRRSPGLSGSELSHAVAPPSEGMWRRSNTDPLLRLGNELLAAVDVVCRTGEGRVGHEVDRKGGDVGRADDAPDGERRAQLLAPRLES